MPKKSATLASTCALLRVVIAGLLLCAVTYGTPTFEPVFNPTLETARVAEAIKVDGNLDDAGWRTAGRAGNFVERFPGENTQPLVETEAFITYDDDNLYVAFVCHDDPAEVRATMCQRDQYSGDDEVTLLVDTFGEAAWAYDFRVNPYGIQKDFLWTSVQGGDRGFDLVWEASARITDSGYQVEMAIPFASMRFPNKDVQSWRVDFQRSHPRDSYRTYSWSANDRNEQCWPCQWGTVDGIRGVHPGKGLELLPSLISSQSGSMVNTGYFIDSSGSRVAIADTLTSPFDNGGILGDVSLGAKYSVSSDITLEATINPDFSQIEADAAQIDVNSTVALMYMERRPFFQEGSDLFRTYFNSFYTRMVNDPELAVKSTARWDRTSLAYMLARDETSPYMIPTEHGSLGAALGRSTVNVLRGLHNLGNNSQVGFMITDRRYDGSGSGTILAGDAGIRLSRGYTVIGQFVHSQTKEPEAIEVGSGVTFDNGKHTVDLDGESYDGVAYITELRHRSRGWNFTLDYNQVSPTYRTQTGYDPWNDQKNMFFSTWYNIWPSGTIFENITPNFFIDRRWNYDARRKWAHFSTSLDLSFRWAQSHLGMSYRHGSELWGDVEFEGLWSVNINANTRPNDLIGLYASVRFGQGPARRTLDKGDEMSLSVGLDLKPIDRLIIEPTLNYVQSKHATTGEKLFQQTILRARTRLQINPQLSVRLVVQHNSSENPVFKEVANLLPPDTAYDPYAMSSYHMSYGSKWEIDPLITYRINSFSMLYLGSTHDYRDFNAAFSGASPEHRMTNRQFFMKIQYLFQT